MINRTRVSLLLVLFSLFGLNNAVAQSGATVDGHVWYDTTPLCALVLANGQSMFSCNPVGSFELLEIPLDANGQIEVQVFASGFAPFKGKVTPSGANPMASLPQVNMVRVQDGKTFQISATYVPLNGEALVRVGGTVSSDGNPICALILANGQKTFTCNDSLGLFSLDVPLDQDGNVTLMAFAGGFQPYKEVTPVDINIPPVMGECINLAGTWRVTDSVSLTCRLGGQSESLQESGSGTAVLEQNGCAIRIADPLLGVPRVGSIDGNRVTLSGQFIGATPEVIEKENILVLEQNVFNEDEFTLVGTGLYTGTLAGSEFRCDGETASSFVRLL